MSNEEIYGDIVDDISEPFNVNGSPKLNNTIRYLVDKMKIVDPDSINEQLAENVNKTNGFIGIDEFPRILPEADDTPRLLRAFTYAMDNNKELQLKGEVYYVSNEILVDRPISIVSKGKRLGFHLGFNLVGVAEIRKTNGDINSNKVINIQTGAEGSYFDGILATCASSETIQYYDASLPTEASGNTSYGFYTGLEVKHIAFNNCAVQQAKVAGFYNETGSVQEYIKCIAVQCYEGHVSYLTDSYFEAPLYHHNIRHGLHLYGAFTRVFNGRFEWNARNGLLSEGAENTITGNTYDRNGFAGLAITSAWNHTVTGNYFSRNGAGGDGTVGRWGFSNPTHPSYITVPEEERCQIRLDYQRNVAMTGNTYRVGKDDANSGANSPDYVYYGNNAIDCVASGNIGEKTGVGCILQVEKLVNSSQKSLLITNARLSYENAVYRSDTTPSAVTTLTVPIANDWAGKIVLTGGAFQDKNLFAEVSVLRVSDAAYGTVHIENKGNVTVTSAYSGTNIVFTFSQAVYANYIKTTYM